MKTNENAHDGKADKPELSHRLRLEERAYYLWLEQGCPHGDRVRHWLQAESELTATPKDEGERRSDVREGK